MRKLSETMIAALRHTAETGKLYRWTGGFWTNQPPPPGWSYEEHGAPEPYWSTGTALALKDRGLLEITERGPTVPLVAEITDAGKEAIEASQ